MNKQKRRVMAVLAMTAALLSGCGAETVDVTRAEKSMQTLTVESTGTVEALHGAPVIPSVSGRIVSALPDVGTAVRAGDVVFQVDSSSYEAQLAAVRAKIKSPSLGTVAAGEAGAEDELLRQGIITRSEYDRLRERRGTVPRGGTADAGLAESEKVLERMIAACTVRAPIDGVISDVYGGNAPIASAGKAVLYIRQNSPVVAETSLPSLLDSFLEKGKAARTLTVTLTDGTQFWYGELKKKPNVTGKAYTQYRVQADNPRDAMTIGKSYGIRIETGEEVEAFALPESVLVGTDAVAAVTPAGLVDWRHVDILRRENGQVIILSGIEEGEKVITKPDEHLEMGMKVNVR